MEICQLDSIDLHYREDGNADGAAVVFINSLGTDLRLWDAILPHLPKKLRYIRYDMRGHGLSACPKAPYSMGALISDIEGLLDYLHVQNALVVGCSIGGMIAQGLAVKRMDQVRAMVLSNTGSKIGTAQMWQERIEAVAMGGIEVLADGVMQRWFSEEFRNTPEIWAWRNLLTRTLPDGYSGCSAAIAGADFYTTTASLTLPTLAIAGSEDGATPPDLVRETAALIRGSRFELIRGTGHLPMVEKPDIYADILNGFMTEIGHV